MVGTALLPLNLFLIWLWFSTLLGWREVTLGKSLAMYLFLLMIIAIFGFGLGSAHGDSLLLAFAWPLVAIYGLSAAVDAHLNLLLSLTFASIIVVVCLLVCITGMARIMIIVFGSVISVFAPAAFDNARVQSQMTKYASERELRVVVRSSLFDSIRDASDGYQNPHGIACDDKNWPHLWSYKQRNWITLPPDTRYGGNTQEDVMRICHQS